MWIGVILFQEGDVRNELWLKLNMLNVKDVQNKPLLG